MKKKFIFAVQWHITERCQNRCKHCYMYDTEYEERVKCEKNFEEYVNILDNIERFEEKYQVSIDAFYITGGDPLAHPDCFRLFDELNKRKKSIHILGIPERITNEMLLLLKTKSVKSYQVSLDGTECTHDEIRGKGSYKRTIDALKLMNEYDLECNVMYTLSVKNYREIYDVIKDLDKNKIRTTFAFDFLVFQGNGSQFKELLSQETVVELLNRYNEMKAELLKQNSTVKLLEKPTLFNVMGANNLFNEEKYADYSVCTGCYCGFSSLAVLPNGDVFPCRRLPVKVGNLFEEELDDILLGNELMQKFRRSEFYEECGNCKNFKICRGCPALAYSWSGSPFSKMPYCFYKKETKKIKDKLPVTDYNGELQIIQKSFLNQLLNCEEKNLFNMIKLLNENIYVSALEN